MERTEITLSTLPKTWFIDLDGTIVMHNGYKNGNDTIIPKSEDFIKNIPETDMIIIVTSREEKTREKTIDFLNRHNIRFDTIIFGLPVGERIIINDSKPSGMKTAYAVNTIRNRGIMTAMIIDKEK